MTKSELIEAVMTRANITKKNAELVVNTVFEGMVEAMRKDERIEIRGFGNFTMKKYGAYEGRNPKTGEKVHVPAKRMPFFKVGKDLKERVNNGG